MFGEITKNRHAALLNRMAETVGVDLTQAIHAGHLHGEAWRDAVLRCCGCDVPDRCISRLASLDGAEVAYAPVYCHNAGMLDRLQVLNRAERGALVSSDGEP